MGGGKKGSRFRASRGAVRQSEEWKESSVAWRRVRMKP